MAALRSITLKWEIKSGRLKCSSCYFKRGERVDVALYITNDGDAYALPSNWALFVTLKGENKSDGDPLAQVTDFSADSETGLYTATAVHISSTALDDYLGVDGDTENDVESALADLDIYYTVVTDVVQAVSDTITLTLKPNNGRTLDETPVAPSNVATQEEAEEGDINNKFMTPLRTMQSIVFAGGQPFHRVLRDDVSLDDGSCVSAVAFVDVDEFTLAFNGNAALEIL